MGPSMRVAVQRIGTIEHVERNVVLRRRFHRVSHRGDVSVETHARILNIKHQRIDSRQHFVRWTPVSPYKL